MHTVVFFVNDTATPEIYTDGHTPSLHDALPSCTENTTGPEPKPIARSVAISRERADTAEYMVLSAPNIAPTAMMPPTKYAMKLSSLVNCLDDRKSTRLNSRH